MRAKIFKGTVLLITGDERFQAHLEQALLRAGYGIRIALSQEEALRELRATTPAIIVVDRRQSGFSRLSQETPLPPPIVTVSYHNEPCDEQHCVMDLEDGATRATCNASPAVIVGLLGAVLRRQRWDQQWSTPSCYVSSGVTVDLENCEVKVGKVSVHVSRTEFRILQSLIGAPGHYLPRKALLDQVWGEGFAIFPHVLDVHIWSLRRKLDSARTNPELITTIKGLGYRLRSALQPNQASSVQVHASSPLTIQAAVFHTKQVPARSARTSTLGGVYWQRQPTQSVSARYRRKPATRGLHLHKHKRPVDVGEALS
jgi:DNA-binding response OmpR family regulator